MKKSNNKEISITDLVPDMRRDIHEIQKEQSEIRFYGKILDENIDKLSKSIGRELTKDERNKVFEIVEYYSPKFRNRDIIDYLPFDFAWEMYKIQKEYDFDENRFKNRHFNEEIFEIAKDNDLSLSEAEQLQEFMNCNDLKDADKAYEAWKVDY